MLDGILPEVSTPSISHYMQASLVLVSIPLKAVMSSARVRRLAPNGMRYSASELHISFLLLCLPYNGKPAYREW